jgi:hypothetical protein
MEWHHAASPKEKKKTRTIPLAGKIMGTVFWGAYWIDFLPQKETVITVHCSQMV